MASRASRAMAEPDTRVSRQPSWPHAQRAPPGSTITWPISPASPRAPRWSRPWRTTPAETPVPTARYARSSTSPTTRRRWRPSAAARTSFSTTHGRPKRASRPPPSGRSDQPRLTASVTAPVSGSTRPGTPTPIAAMSSGVAPAWARAPSTTAAISSTARSWAPAGGRCDLAGQHALVAIDHEHGDLAPADIDADEQRAIAAVRGPTRLGVHRGTVRPNSWASAGWRGVPFIGAP